MTLAMLLFGSSVALFLPLHRRTHFWQRPLLCYGVAAGALVLHAGVQLLPAQQHPEPDLGHSDGVLLYHTGLGG